LLFWAPIIGTLIFVAKLVKGEAQTFSPCYFLLWLLCYIRQFDTIVTWFDEAQFYQSNLWSRDFYCL